jgi:inositol transport system permease protein
MSKTKIKYGRGSLYQYSMLMVLLVLFIVCSLMNPNFFTVNNLTNISRQLAVTTILAFGQTVLIISGMLDLSQGSVLALSGVLSISAYKASGSLVLAFAIAIIVAVGCNLINAAMVATAGAPPFIVTLAMQAMARGAALLFTNGQNIVSLDRYIIFGQGNILGLPTPILFLAALFIVTWYVLRHTRLGRSLYAIGGNEEASVASGISVKRSKYLAFIFNGILVGIAGVLFMSRVNAGLPNGAVGFETQALTSAIIGGTSFSGGIGTASGTLTGAFIVGFLDNIMNLTRVGSYVQQIVRGGIIALAVITDIVVKKWRTKSSFV